MSVILSDNNSAAIKFLRKQSKESEMLVAFFISKCLHEAVTNIPHTFATENDFTDCAFMIMNEYEEELKPEELIIILRNGITGKYGKMYHAVSKITIMEWVLQYVTTERRVWFENKISNTVFDGEKLIEKGDNINTLADIKSEVVKKEFRELKEKVTTNYIQEAKEREQAWKRVLQNLTNDFDALYKTQKPGDMSAIRFVKYNDEQIDYTKYMEVRLKELNQNK